MHKLEKYLIILICDLKTRNSFENNKKFIIFSDNMIGEFSIKKGFFKKWGIYLNAEKLTLTLFRDKGTSMGRLADTEENFVPSERLGTGLGTRQIIIWDTDAHIGRRWYGKWEDFNKGYSVSIGRIHVVRIVGEKVLILIKIFKLI